MIAAVMKAPTALTKPAFDAARTHEIFQTSSLRRTRRMLCGRALTVSSVHRDRHCRRTNTVLHYARLDLAEAQGRLGNSHTSSVG